MNRQTFLIVLVLVVCGGGVVVTGTVAADSPENTSVLIVFTDLPADEISSSDDPADILQVHANESLEPLHHKAKSAPGLTVQETFWIVPAATISINTSQISIESLEELDGVTYLEQSPESLELASTRTGGYSTESTATSPLERIGVPEAWTAFETRGEGSSITILDTGVDGDHPDISVSGWNDFSDDPSEEPIDYGDHGTHVAGIAVGKTTPDGTSYGVAPDSTLNIGAVATDCDPRCSASMESILHGMEWGIEQESDVISISLGREAYATPFINVTQNTIAVGIPVVASAGNSGEGTSASPGNVYDVIAVGAIDESGDVWHHSSGEEIDRDVDWEGEAPDEWPERYTVPDIVAPGVAIESALPGDEYGTKTGTSMAAPHVAGVIALIQSATDTSYSPETIRDALSKTAVHPDGTGVSDTRYGFGVVDTVGAIEALRSPATVKGTVLADKIDGPISNVTVSIHVGERTISSTESQTDGQFEFTDIPSRNDLNITGKQSGYHSTTTSIVAPPGERLYQDIILVGNATLALNTSDAVTAYPLEDTKITIVRDDGYESTLPSRTDELGTITTTLPGTGETYSITTERTGYVTATASITLDNAAHESVHVPLSGDGMFELTTTDDLFSVSVDDADPLLSNDRGNYAMQTSSGGAYSFESIPTDRSYSLTVSAPGYEEPHDVSVTFDEVPQQQREVSLIGNSTITLLVSDAVTEAPLDNAEISIERSGGQTATLDAELDGDGGISIAVPGTRSSYRVSTSSAGYTPTMATQYVGSAETHTLAMMLHGDTPLTVAIKGELFGESIENATVLIENERGRYDSSRTGTGLHSVEYLPSDIPYTVAVEATGYEGYERTESTPAAATLTVHLTGSATISALVESNDGDPIENAELTVEREDGETHTFDETTDNSGRHTFAVPGQLVEYAVSATAAGYATDSVTTDPLDHRGTTSVTLQLAEDGALSGFGAGIALGAIVIAFVLSRRYRRA